MNSILIGMLLATLGLASSFYYRQDAIESKAFYQSELARINAESAAFKQQSEDSIHGIETKRLKDKETADQRIKQLAKRQGPSIASCRTDSAGNIRANVSDSAISVLSEAVNDDRLSKAIDTTSPASAP